MIKCQNDDFYQKKTCKAPSNWSKYAAIIFPLPFVYKWQNPLITISSYLGHLEFSSSVCSIFHRYLIKVDKSMVFSTCLTVK